MWSGDITDDEFAAWFRLLQTPGVGRDLARRLLAACGSPAAVFSAPASVLQQLVGSSAARGLASTPPQYEPRLAAALQWLHGGADRHLLTLGHPAWPPALLQTADPPLLLYVQGDVAALARPSLAIVGSRNPTAQGRDNARNFAQALGEIGYVIVSGLARGIDGAAHEGALQTRSGTVAVVGTGLDLVYPPSHQELAQRIAQHGALVSEFAPGTPGLPDHFPLRNRIIAGLSRGTLVVEAALQSGSLITARLALEGGREVFAIPGSIHSPQSKGCHALIKQGAKLVESAADIVDELGGMRPATRSLATADNEPAAQPRFAALLEALGHDPVTLDALMARTGCSAAQLSALLLELELDGRAARLPGGLYQRRVAG
ncbi:MAG TPA: DNA-processing protein DprA [Rubrivivax sp.]|nr:DNA-processing protein DprA [Rubrivivax sp.]